MQDLKITIVQSPLHWESVEENLEMFSGKMAAVRGTDIIVLPEMFSTGFTMNAKKLAENMEGGTMQWLRQQAKERGCIVTGSFIVEEEGRYFNRLVWMRPDGSYQYYDKRHLFRMGNEHHYYSSGTRKLIVELNGWKICPLVCYDLRFPVWSRNRRSKDTEYDLLIYVANWPEKRSHAWQTLLQARAIENLCFVAGVNRIGNDGNDTAHSGNSAVINFKGEEISATQPNTENAETVSLSYGELSEFRKSFPAMLDADDFKINE